MGGMDFVKTESNGTFPINYLNLSTRTEMSSGTTRDHPLQNVNATLIISKNQGVKLTKDSKNGS